MKLNLRNSYSSSKPKPVPTDGHMDWLSDGTGGDKTTAETVSFLFKKKEKFLSSSGVYNN